MRPIFPESAGAVADQREPANPSALDSGQREALTAYLISLAATARNAPGRAAAIAFRGGGGTVLLTLSLNAGRPMVELAAGSGAAQRDHAVLDMLQYAVLRVPVPQGLAASTLLVTVPVESLPGE